MDQIDSLSTRPTSDLLKSSIRSQFDLFVALSARIGSLQEDLDLLRKNYRQYIGKLRGDLRDPFVQPQRNSSKLDIITNSNTCPTPGTQIAPSKPLINNNPGGNSSFMNNPYNMPNTGGLQNSSIKNSQNTNHQTSSLNSLNFPSATTNVPVPSLSSKPSSSTNFTWGSNSNTITNGNLQTPANFLFNPNK